MADSSQRRQRALRRCTVDQCINWGRQNVCPMHRRRMSLHGHYGPPLSTKPPAARCACGCGMKVSTTGVIYRRGHAPAETFREFIENRVLPRIDMAGDCWEWTGARSSAGYGQSTFQQKRYTVTRALWEYHNGPIPDGLVICHKCDNPPCCRMDHLFIGTTSDNARDMVAKGRHFALYGEESTNCKLSDADVREIRRRRSEGESTASLAREFDIHPGYVTNLVALKWRKEA